MLLWLFLKSLYLLHIQCLEMKLYQGFCFKVVHFKYTWGREGKSTDDKCQLKLVIAKVRGWLHGSSR